MTRAMAAVAVILLLAACGGGARDVDYTRERAISADIEASRFQGANNSFPGWSSHDEPVGAYSWQFDRR